MPDLPSLKFLTPCWSDSLIPQFKTTLPSPVSPGLKGEARSLAHEVLLAGRSLACLRPGGRCLDVLLASTPCASALAGASLPPGLLLSLPPLLSLDRMWLALQN